MVRPVEMPAEPIVAGATYALPLVRAELDYPTYERDGVVYKMDGTPVPDTDYAMENYDGCTAAMELRDATSNDLLATLTTENGGIELDGPTLTLKISAADTTAPALAPFDSAIGHVEVRRLDGSIERQYELSFAYSPQRTEIEPA